MYPVLFAMLLVEKDVICVIPIDLVYQAVGQRIINRKLIQRATLKYNYE
jgi:hypothetical protein